MIPLKNPKKAINNRDSQVVTHLSTSRSAYGLSTAERTGSPVFHILWSIAKGIVRIEIKCLAYLSLDEKVRTGFDLAVHLGMLTLRTALEAAMTIDSSPMGRLGMPTMWCCSVIL